MPLVSGDVAVAEAKFRLAVCVVIVVSVLGFSTV